MFRLYIFTEEPWNSCVSPINPLSHPERLCFVCCPLRASPAPALLITIHFPQRTTRTGTLSKMGGRRRDKDSSSQDEPWLFKILSFSKQIHRGLDSQLLLENASPPSWHFPRVMSGGPEEDARRHGSRQGWHCSNPDWSCGALGGAHVSV